MLLFKGNYYEVHFQKIKETFKIRGWKQIENDSVCLCLLWKLSMKPQKPDTRQVRIKGKT